MLPSQRHSWTKWQTQPDASAKVASSKSRSRWGHPAQPQEQRRLSISGADISDTAANVEGEATLRLLADPELYAEFQARLRQHRLATNVATHELLRQFLAEKKYCDGRIDQTTNTGSLSRSGYTGSTDDVSDNAQMSPKTVPGRLGNFLQKNQERQHSQIAAGNGSLPSLEELSEKKRMQRRSTMDVVSMGSSSSVSTHTTSATDNSSFEVSLSGLIQPTSWFSRKG